MNKYLESKHLKFNLVEENDAEFILELRKNPNLNKFISATNISVEDQKRWIKNYKKKEVENKEYYFRIDDKSGEKLGFVRVYNINNENKEFTWGSWILREDRPKYGAIESALIIYNFTFNYLKMEKCVFDVRKENLGVLKFHKKLGAIEVSEDELNKYFELPKSIYYSEIKEKYKRFLNVE